MRFFWVGVFPTDRFSWTVSIIRIFLCVLNIACK